MKLFKEKFFRFSVRDIIITLLLLVATTVLCYLLGLIDNTVPYESMLFILAVFIISKNTHGYFCGIAASVISVLTVNYFFTYPYYVFNFTLSGYPVTIICMLAVSIVTSTLTTQIKNQEAIKIEAEREKTRSNLLRAISHDLRTPLTSILGACSAIIENDDYISKGERLDLLYSMKEDSAWLIRMVENLLSITRIDDGGAAKIIKKVEAVEEIIAASVEKFKKKFPETNVIVSIPDELLFVPMDAVLIEQVIINLLENSAVHAKGSTETRLSVSVNESNVEFSVSDNGAGIPKSILPNIFDGYFNSSYEKSSDTKRNMGIGLSVCHTIIKAHNGVLTAENLKSGGACFKFTLSI